MSLLPPNNDTDSGPLTPTPKVKASPQKRKPAARRRQEPPQDTPNPPTPPEPEPIPDDIPKPKAKAPRAGSLEARLNEAFASISVLPSFAGDQYSSFILASRSQAFCHNLAELAKVNKGVKRVLENALDGGAYGGVIFSGAAMILPIAWAYGIIPPPPFDPFAAFYPSVPAGVVPRSAARAAGSSAGGRVDHPPVRNPVTPDGGAPGAPISNAPEGVVTVKPGAHPPINPAAL